MLLEVDVQPFAAGRLRLARGDLDDLGSDAAASRGGRDHRVLQPSVDETVPEGVDEAHERGTVTGDDPPEAVALQLLDPVPLVFGVDTVSKASASRRFNSSFSTTPRQV
jgi:hypothetical protein